MSRQTVQDEGYAIALYHGGKFSHYFSFRSQVDIYANKKLAESVMKTYSYMKGGKSKAVKVKVLVEEIDDV